MVKKYTTKISNEVRLTSRDFSINASRLFQLGLIEMINTPTFQKLYPVRLVDYLAHTGVKSGAHLYREIENIADQATKANAVVKRSNGFRYFSPVTEADYQDGEGIILVGISHTIYEATQVERNYTTIDTRQILSLRRPISQLVYDFLIRHQFRSTPLYLSVDEYRQELGLTKKYKAYAEFKRVAITWAYDDLLKDTNLSFSYEEVKRNKKVIGIWFHIGANKKRKFNLLHREEEAGEQKAYGEDAVNLLKEYGIQKSKAIKILDARGVAYVEANLAVVDRRVKDGAVDDVGAYTLGALKSDYAGEATAKTKKKKQLKGEKAEEKRKAKEKVANDLQKEEEEREKAKELEKLYKKAILEEVKQKVTDAKYEEVAEKFYSELNQFTKDKLEEDQASIHDYLENKWVRLKFIECLASNCLDDHFKTLEAWVKWNE